MRHIFSFRAACLLVALGGSGSTRAAAALPEGKRYAVLVGVKAYDHAKLSPLEYTENDVTELDGLLRPAGYDVALLTDATGSKNPKRAPTKENIESVLKEVLDKCKRGDLVLVALAGHGLQFDGATDSYFCPRDAKPLKDRTDTLISVGALYKRLDDSGAGVKILLVDACRNDPGQRGAGWTGAARIKRRPRACSRSSRAGPVSVRSNTKA